MKNLISIIKSKFTSQDKQPDQNAFILPLGHHYLSIHAHYNAEHITLYMASETPTTTTDTSCLPPISGITLLHLSWCLTMYQTNYSNTSHILALSLKHSEFISLLHQCQLSQSSENDKYSKVPFVQWELERDPTLQLQTLEHRNLKIGIPAEKSGIIRDRIVKVSDVTQMAKNLKNILSLASDPKELSVGRLRELGVMPEERVYEVSQDIEKHLGMR